jgi:uncharacterized protein (TIGR03437 family)
MNMRVLVLCLCAPVIPVSLLFGDVVYNSVPSRIVGQAVLQQTTQTAIAPNLVEGRELNSPQSVAVDMSANPPILYVADTVNNRILAWKNATGFQNGDPADLVLGQRDKYSTLPRGPGTDLIAGFRTPDGVAVDDSGNLYVADAGNNRILRFPQPFNQTTDVFQPDLVIGQKDLSSVYPNQGTTPPTASSICLSTSGSVYRTGMVFDSSGNLYVSDACNNRVLRFPKAVLQSGGFAPLADLVLGQSTFGSNGLPNSGLDPTQKDYIAQPAGLAIDKEGRLYVADAVNRVLVFDVPVANGQAALRIMGVIPPTAQQPIPPSITAGTLGSSSTPPNGVVVVGDNPYVVDTGNHRIVGYAPFSQWPLEASSFSPSANVVIGQPDMLSRSPNHGGVEADASSLFNPVTAVWTGSTLFVADGSNHRVLAFPQASQDVVATTATGVLGQTDFPYDAPNLIEGREFYFFATNVSSGGVSVPYPGGAVVIDPTSNPPHMYVSDPGNNRVLGFADYRKVGPGTKADIVIGQPDFSRRIVNYPATTTETRNGLIIGVPNNSGLSVPEGLALDASGNLWVADTGNSRVLRFPPPFAQTGQLHANLVLGQADFISYFPDPGQRTMNAPYGVAVTASGQVLVSDIGFNRILLFTQPSGGDFVNGQAAAGVLGQLNFFFTSSGTPANNGLNGPRLMATDAQDNLYVADTGNNRIAVYANASTPAVDPSPSFSLTSLTAPVGVSVSSVTGQVWVANTGGNAVLQYPPFSQLVANPAPVSGVASAEPLAVTFDPLGNPVIAESTNRVAFYYPVMDMKSSANYFLRYAPGMLASLFHHGTAMFGPATVPASSLPLSTTLGDVQVLVEGVAAPLLYASPTQINFQIPMATPVGLTEVQTVQASTGQILASSFFNIQAASPALFAADASGVGQVLALNNPDGSINSAKNPVKAGQFISLFGTGQGFVAGAPPDGTAPTVATPTAETPLVYINGPNFLNPSDVQYSGLAPNYVGLWQINAKVPADASPGAVVVLVGMDGFYSNLDTAGNHIQTTIYVKQ